METLLPAGSAVFSLLLPKLDAEEELTVDCGRFSAPGSEADVQPLSNDSYGLCAVLKYFPSKKRGVLGKTLRFLIQGTWFFSLKMRDKFYKNIFHKNLYLIQPYEVYQKPSFAR